MAFDFYRCTDELIDDLRTQGFHSWAENLDNAVAAGATGTEILMAIRWELLELLKKKPNCKKETFVLIDEILLELEKSLK